MNDDDVVLCCMMKLHAWFLLYLLVPLRTTRINMMLVIIINNMRVLACVPVTCCTTQVAIEQYSFVASRLNLVTVYTVEVIRECLIMTCTYGNLKLWNRIFGVYDWYLG